MDLYLDANATTPVLPAAREAALAAMAEDFGNPSSLHSTGLKARALMEGVRATARRVLGVPDGQLLFVSGATEGIQTAVLSALVALRGRAAAGEPCLLLYGATEHKAVPEALRHWAGVLGLTAQIQAIPVGRDGRHDLDWLRARAPGAGLVCTMAANNETGVISDLDGIAGALQGSAALWLVDGVQALGKLDLGLGRLPIDYAPFSGHKLYAPKGIGLLYVREGAPFTPLMAGGGQEGAARSGTENMAGIAALGAVLDALERADSFERLPVLAAWRDMLVRALRETFPGIVFHAPLAVSLPTTLNFSVPGVSSKVLLDLFDAAGIRASGGSACSAAKAAPSHVLLAMGLTEAQAASAVRLSFGPARQPGLIEAACERLRACAPALVQSCLTVPPDGSALAPGALPLDGLHRLTVAGACCYLLADSGSRRAVIVDPLPELTGRLVQLLTCHQYTLVAALDTHSHGDHVSSAAELWAAMPAALVIRDPADALGWPLGADMVRLGQQRLTRLPIPGHTLDSTAYLVHGEDGQVDMAFVGDMVLPGALGRSDFPQSAPQAFATSLRSLAATLAASTLLLPGHDYEDRFATTLAVECGQQPLLAAALARTMDTVAFAEAKAALEVDIDQTAYNTLSCGARVDSACGSTRPELSRQALLELIRRGTNLRLVDVREAYEQQSGLPADLASLAPMLSVPVSGVLNALPDWLALPDGQALVLLCRSGQRSAVLAQALRRLGSVRIWSLAGGVALWPTGVQFPAGETRPIVVTA